ncbi:MAG: rane protein of unknown function [Candidatus Saccharibacteria bacterium]|nr:rane protein of unknown function [Candidatus Saccharibacteria bacterium]
MNKSNTTELGDLLKQSTKNISSYDTYLQSTKHEETVHVSNVANVILFAYEQLRNASENIEDHLLLQRAILRFYKRNLSFINKRDQTKLAEELIIELTQAEYLANDTIPVSMIAKLDDLIGEYYQVFWKIRDKHADVSVEKAEKWVLDILSVKSEQLFNNPIRILSFAHFAHAHFTKLIDYKTIILPEESIDASDYPTLLYIGIHKALLKSDDANIRSGLLDLYSVGSTKTAHFIEFNTKYDQLSALRSAVRLSRFINKNGAPLRILRSAFFEQKNDNLAIDLHNQSQLMNVIEQQIDKEYQAVRKSVNNGVIKSILFLLITKAIIGMLVEIPYDIVVTGSIIIVPLIINLLFPPLFLALTALTFKLPGEPNKKALTKYIMGMVYKESEGRTPTLKYAESTGNTLVFNIIYIAVFLGVFYLVSTRLIALDFNIVQAVIFIIFLSTASFLGYRLTLQIKELELVNTSQGFIALIRDFLYAPFIFVGQKISYRFGQLNIMAQILDVVIDLPLKTIVRLVRQWMVFLNNKKDELL